MVTAGTAIKANLGVAIYAYVFAALAGAWAVCWALAVMGVFDQTYTCMEVNGVDVCTNPNYGILFVLFLAFFFVQQVLQVTLYTYIYSNMTRVLRVLGLRRSTYSDWTPPNTHT